MCTAAFESGNKGFLISDPQHFMHRDQYINATKLKAGRSQSVDNA